MNESTLWVPNFHISLFKIFSIHLYADLLLELNSLILLLIRDLLLIEDHLKIEAVPLHALKVKKKYNIYQETLKIYLFPC